MKQKLDIKHLASIRDCFGVWEVEVSINNVIYTYPLSSEYLVKKVEKLIRLKHYGKALNVLRVGKISGFNSFEEEVKNGVQSRRGEHTQIPGCKDTREEGKEGEGSESLC